LGMLKKTGTSDPVVEKKPVETKQVDFRGALKKSDEKKEEEVEKVEIVDKMEPIVEHPVVEEKQPEPVVEAVVIEPVVEAVVEAVVEEAVVEKQAPEPDVSVVESVEVKSEPVVEQTPVKSEPVVENVVPEVLPSNIIEVALEGKELEREMTYQLSVEKKEEAMAQESQ